MDSWLYVPILYLLLIFSQMTTADLPEGRDDSDIAPQSGISASQGADSPDFVRLFLMAMQNNYRAPSAWRSHNVGIPFRPVRRIGSEFLGKRSELPINDDEVQDVDKRARIGSEFLGKRRMGSEFLGKRRMGSEFLGKRRMGSEFLGKRRMGSEFLGKRRMGSEFLGKRRMGSEFLGKRRMGSEFLGKRGMGSEFLGKRRMGSEFLGKRDQNIYPDSDQLEMVPLVAPIQSQMEEAEIPSRPDEGFYSQIVKRGLGSEFLGKRKPNVVNEYTYKRGRLGSEFLGKRSTEPEQPIPYLQTDRDFDLLNSSIADDKSEEKLNTGN